MREKSEKDYTHGTLYNLNNGQLEHLCYIIEDEFRYKKIKHETRIPAGFYQIIPRVFGGYHQRYLKRYGGNWHKGMLEIVGVNEGDTNFTDILIHTGNNESHTSGCLIVGKTKYEGGVGNSRDAYKELYPKLIRQAENSNLYIHICDSILDKPVDLIE